MKTFSFFFSPHVVVLHVQYNEHLNCIVNYLNYKINLENVQNEIQSKIIKFIFKTLSLSLLLKVVGHVMQLMINDIYTLQLTYFHRTTKAKANNVNKIRCQLFMDEFYLTYNICNMCVFVFLFSSSFNDFHFNM